MKNVTENLLENKPDCVKYFYTYMVMFVLIGACLAVMTSYAVQYHGKKVGIKHTKKEISNMPMGISTKQVIEQLGYPIYAESFEDGVYWYYQTYLPTGREKNIIDIQKTMFTQLTFNSENMLTGISK